MTTTKTTISQENKLTPKMMEVFAEESNETSELIKDYIKDYSVQFERSEILEWYYWTTQWKTRIRINKSDNLKWYSLFIETITEDYLQGSEIKFFNVKTLQTAVYLWELVYRKGSFNPIRFSENQINDYFYSMK